MDASFLHQEKRASHMHLGALAVFEGPPPEPKDFIAHMESRLPLVPRYRQKLAFPRFELGRPFWIDDPSFNLDYHVRHTALPRPGGGDELRQLAGRIFSQRLDRSKPLWEVWVVQGLELGRFALIWKTHHALVDGVAGVDIATVLFDLRPAAQGSVGPKQPARPAAQGSGGPKQPARPAAQGSVSRAELSASDGWVPRPEPSDAELVVEGIKDLIRTPIGLAGLTLEAIREPGRSLERAREAAEGVGEVVWAGMNPAPDVPLNVPIGSHRRVSWVRSRLDDFKDVKNALGGTVNDAVLAVVAGALGRWLQTRGVRTEGLELRALVPVSIRSENDQGALGNRIAAMRGSLPVYVDDPVERLRQVRESMGNLKQSKQALGAEVIAGLQDFAPPTLLAQASRVNFSTRLFNLLVTNVPGPQFPLYLLGSEMEEVVPIAFLPENHALAIAIVSYNGKVDFGLLADYDAMPDLADLGGFLEDALDELRKAARGKAKATARANGAKRRGPRKAAQRAPAAD